LGERLSRLARLFRAKISKQNDGWKDESGLFRTTLTELMPRRNNPRDACYRVGGKFLINGAGAIQCGGGERVGTPVEMISSPWAGKQDGAQQKPGNGAFVVTACLAC